jgi:hypothetical protein
MQGVAARFERIFGGAWRVSAIVGVGLAACQFSGRDEAIAVPQDAAVTDAAFANEVNPAVDAEMPPLQDADDDAAIDSGASVARLTLLQANVGNVSLDCKDYRYKLCSTLVEGRIRESIRNVRPGVVTLQEVVPNQLCANVSETNNQRACHPGARIEAEAQVRRLVGANYTIACDTRHQWDCLAVRVDLGEVEGCAKGAVCNDARVGRTLGVDPACDDGFTLTGFRVRLNGQPPFTLVNGHPPSGGGNADCRKRMLQQVFEGASPLAGTSRGLISGDFNLDPFNGNDVSEAYFRSWVGAGKRLTFHSGIAESSPPRRTAFYLNGSHVWDHVASDFLRGTCQTLGEAPGTARLDQGSGTDHRALLCNLEF